jgi:hypothetical protein
MGRRDPLGPATRLTVAEPARLGRSLRSDLLQIAFLPRYPNDEELQVASAVTYE